MRKASSSKQAGTERGTVRIILLSVFAYPRHALELYLIHSVAHFTVHCSAKAPACEDTSMSVARMVVSWDGHFVAHKHSYAIVDLRNVRFEMSSTQWGLLSFGSAVIFFPCADFVVHLSVLGRICRCIKVSFLPLYSLPVMFLLFGFLHGVYLVSHG